MRERVELLVGQSRGMWVMTFHAACGRILRREADRLGYRSNFTIYDQADQVRVVKACLEELGRDPKRFPPRGIHSRISSEKNRLVSAAMFRENIGNFFDQVVADVFELYERRMHASNAMDFDDMLVRTRRAARELRRRARALAGRVQPPARRRVPGHEPRPVPHRAPALRRAPQRDGRRRRRSGDLHLARRRHPQHPRLRARLPGRARRAPRAELPLDAAHPRRRQRGHRAQRGAHREAALERARQRRARPRDRGRGRARRGAHRRGAHRRAHRGRLERLRDRGLLPHERAVARARGSARAPRRALPGDRRPALLRARRGQGRDGVPERARQPDRRDRAAPHHQPAAARHRRRQRRPPGRHRGLRRRLALGRARPIPRAPAWAPRRPARCARSAP